MLILYHLKVGSKLVQKSYYNLYDDLHLSVITRYWELTL